MDDEQGQPAISVQGVSLVYEDVTVLKGIDLSIPKGAVVGLVGRNGAGKSTLLRCLVGLSVPQQGQALVLGDPSLTLSDATREQLGYVGQQPDLLGWLTVWEHVRYIGSFYKNFSEHRARNLLIRLELGEGRRVSQLSGGDAQKLSVVLALAHDPSVVIMDEPVASLDPMTRREFLRTLFERGDDSSERTVLLSSHLLTDLERVASHLCFMRDGHVQWFGQRDAVGEKLVLAESAAPLGQQPGVLTQTAVRGAWRHAIDADHFHGPWHGLERLQLSLEDLFIELNRAVSL